MLNLWIKNPVGRKQQIKAQSLLGNFGDFGDFDRQYWPFPLYFLLQGVTFIDFFTCTYYIFSNCYDVIKEALEEMK